MEKLYIILGSLVIPAVTICALIVLKHQREKQRAVDQAAREKDQELIGTLEELVETKNDYIKRLQ